MRDKAKVRPIIYGGGQQKGFRSGTENVPGIAGLGVAAELFCKTLNLCGTDGAGKKHLIEGLKALEDVTVNGVSELSLEETAPHIVSASLLGGVQ